FLANFRVRAPPDAFILPADFNASPTVPSRRLFIEAGLADTAEESREVGRSTFHSFYGIAWSSIDGILIDRHWRVPKYLVLDMKPKNIYPSDHFGLLADLQLQK